MELIKIFFIIIKLNNLLKLKYRKIIILYIIEYNVINVVFIV